MKNRKIRIAALAALFLFLTFWNVPVALVANNNQPPIILDLTYSYSCGDSYVNFAVQAYDPDGDPLTIWWEAQFFWDRYPVKYGMGSGSSVNWAPPREYEDKSNLWTITVTVIDGKGGITQKSIDFYFDRASSIGSWKQEPEPGIVGREVRFTVFTDNRSIGGDHSAGDYSIEIIKPGGQKFTSSKGKTIAFVPDMPGNWFAYVYVCTLFGGNRYIGGFSINIRENTPPVIQNLTYEPNPAIPGREVRVNVFAVDPDGDPLTYAWTVKKPNGQQITLPNNATVTFQPDMPGNWTVVVTVRDPYGGVATRSQTITVADFSLNAAVEPPEASRGQKIMIYASLTEPDGRRIQADSISATLPNGGSIGLRWDSALNRYTGEYLIPDGGAPGVWPGDGSYEIRVRATKYGITKEQVLRVVIRGNIKEKLYIRQIQF